MSLTRITPINGEAILPLAEARACLNIDEDDTFHDTRVALARDLAIDFAERHTSLIFSATSFIYECGDFSTSIPLPRKPVISVDGIDYRDADGEDASLTESDWSLSRGAASPAFGGSWPTGDNVRIEFTAGHPDLASVPPILKAGMVVAMAAYFEDQENPNLDGARKCLAALFGVLGA